MNKKPAHLSILLALMILMPVMMWIASSPIGQSLDNVYYDIVLQGHEKSKTSNDIVIVGIDEASFAELNMQWPWPREYHARLLDTLYKANASVVAFDILFSEPSDPQSDLRFAESLSRWPNTLLAQDINLVEQNNWIQEIRVKPSETLNVSDKQLGVINIPTQSDGMVRDLNLAFGNDIALSLATARKYDKSCCQNLPLDYKIWINYSGPAGTINTVSYYQALDPEKYLGSDFFRNKIVLVGTVTQNAVSINKKAVDHFPVPSSRFNEGYMAGVEIHANALANLLNSNYVTPISSLVLWLLSLTLSITFAIVFIRLKPAISVLLAISCIIILILISIALYHQQHIYMPLALILLPVATAWPISPIAHYYHSNKEKQFIENAFGAYLAPDIVKDIINNPHKLSLGGKNVDASILFLDVAGFTTMSEKFEPAVLISIMNHCLGAVTEKVMEHEGMIDKFIGDAIMATWGAVTEQPNHAFLACLSALEIQQRMKEVAATEKQVTGAELSARVGVNSGICVAGNVGGTKRFSYTVHGNEVNVASRLEGANKFYNTEIIIGENTARQVMEYFELRLLDKVRLKGKKTAIGLYELQAVKGANSQAMELCNQHYEKARTLYESSMFAEAVEEFRKGLYYIKTDGPSLAMIARCKEYLVKPPGTDWDGIHDMTSK